MMSDKINLMEANTTLKRLDGASGVSQAVENHSKRCDMLIPDLGVDNNIINITVDNVYT